MSKLLLLGDEAIAQAFIDAGGSAINSYPGTPSTQITEYVIKSKEAAQKGIRANWCANEKTALEASIGVAYAGKRAMTCMTLAWKIPWTEEPGRLQSMGSRRVGHD